MSVGILEIRLGCGARGARLPNSAQKMTFSPLGGGRGEIFEKGEKRITTVYGHVRKVVICPPQCSWF